ncbi:MAG TPA: alpha/beta hydrolase [Chloroflexia bacterium]|nr:alpha/beta hydrolase [Chloroflexia bacterium]
MAALYDGRAAMIQGGAADGNQGRHIQVKDLSIYYEEYGQGEPLILLHGGTATLRSWQEHLPAFAEHFRVIAVDSRGHGRTNNPAGELGYSQMADDVSALVEALNLTRPLVFGYSDGGQTAMELGIRYPDLTQALVLGGTAYKFRDSYFAALRGFGVEDPANLDLDRMQAEQPDWVTYMQAEHTQADDPAYWKTLMTQISGLWWNVHDYGLADLQRITTPTLILLGDRDEGVEVEQAVEMYRGIPNAELAILPNASHGHLNAIAISTIIDFLKRQLSTSQASDSPA